METIFIADIHLKEENSLNTVGFLRFLNQEALSADALYILGDLFETWIGDDDPNPVFRKIAFAIKKLIQSGVPCFFIRGNHDVLVGKRFAHEAGVVLLPEKNVLSLYGHNILIMHGDALCINDINYQIFRNRINKKWIQILFLAMPVFIRKFVVSQIKLKSKIINNKKSQKIRDVNSQKVVKMMEENHVQWLIHGHTHSLNIHKLIVNGKPAFRIALGAWNNTGSMVRVTPKNIELLRFLL